MTKIKLLGITVFGLLIINLILIGFLFFKKPPHPAGDNPPHKRGGPKNIIIEKLRFDKEQTAQYEKLIDQHRSSIRAKEDSILIVKNKLYQSLAEENISEKDSLINILGNIQKEIEQINYDHFADIKKICRPDQLIYFNELVNELAEFFSPQKNKPPPPKDN